MVYFNAKKNLRDKAVKQSMKRYFTQIKAKIDYCQWLVDQTGVSLDKEFGSTATMSVNKKLKNL